MCAHTRVCTPSSFWFLLIIFLLLHLVPGRVRVAVRLRPQNEEELASDADFADCVELQPEVNISCFNHDVPVLEGWQIF